MGGPADQPVYLNAVVRWRPAAAWASPVAALAALLAIETALGRRRRERWGPRTIDLDLLDWRGATVSARTGAARVPRLPHPRAHERAFVLVPWAEIAPAWPCRDPRGLGSTTIAAAAREVGGFGVRPAPALVRAAWDVAVGRPSATST